MLKRVTVTDITYDTDGENIDLPKELTVELPEDVITDDDISEYVSDYISNYTGYCHFGFNLK
jgi:hypothetical protein